MSSKVCIITTVHRPFDTRIFHKEAKTLAKAGYEVTLIAQHDKNEVVNGIKIIALSRPKNRVSRMIFLGWGAYKLALKQNADVYHFHDPEFLPWAKRLKNKTGAKVIYDVHEDYPSAILLKSWIPLLFRYSLSKIFNIYEKKTAKNLDYVIAAWLKIKENFEKSNIGRIANITNYPILKYFSFGNNINEFNKNVHEKKIKLIYVGGLTKIRGIKQIIQSLKYIKNENIKLILVGNFQEKAFKKELTELQEWKKVEYKGWLKQVEAYKEMKNADVGLLCFLPAPNHLHSVPNKLFEYMAAGLPVVATDFHFLKEIIQQNNCGICVNPLDLKEIAEAINYLISHREESMKMGDNGRNSVKEKYNWENESIKLLDIYQELKV